MPVEDQETLARDLKVNLVQNPNKYLGLNFKMRGNRMADFQFLIERFSPNCKDGKLDYCHRQGEQLLFPQFSNPYPYIPFHALESLIRFAN